MEYKCPDCNGLFQNAQEFCAHYNECHGLKKSSINVNNKRFQCNLCDYGSDKNWLVKRHKRLIHRIKENPRAIDDKIIKNGNKKPSIYVKNKKFQCNLCDYGSDRTTDVKRHMKLMHGEGQQYTNSRVNQNTSFNRDSPEVNNVGENKEGLRKN